MRKSMLFAAAIGCIFGLGLTNSWAETVPHSVTITVPDVIKDYDVMVQRIPLTSARASYILMSTADLKNLRQKFGGIIVASTEDLCSSWRSIYPSGYIPKGNERSMEIEYEWSNSSFGPTPLGSIIELPQTLWDDGNNGVIDKCSLNGDQLTIYYEPNPMRQ